MELIEMATKNTLFSKIRLVIISMFVGFGLIVLELTMGISSVAKNAANDSVEELNSNNYIRIYPRISGTYIPTSKFEQIKKMDGIKSAIGQYNIFGLLEKETNNPIYSVSVTGFDFNEGVVSENCDFRGNNVSGILLPDITVELNGKKVMSDYIGSNVFFTYEYREGENIISKTVECNVLGTYKAYGSMEENPIYMSLDLFNGIVQNVCKDGNGMLSLMIYVDDIENLDVIANEINNMGFDVSYETTKEDFLNYIKGFKKIGLIVAIICLFMAGIIIIQTINNNIQRRAKAIGVLKVFGYSNRSIYKMIIIELSIYYILGMMIATVVCAMLDSKISDVLSPILMNQEYTFHFHEVLWFILFGFVLCSVITIKPLLKCKRLQPIDILKGEV